MRKFLLLSFLGSLLQAAPVNYHQVNLIVKFGIPQDVTVPIFYKSYISGKESRCFCGALPTIFVVGLGDLYGFCPKHAHLIIEKLKAESEKEVHE